VAAAIIKFAIGVIFKTPQSNREMRSGMPRAARLPIYHAANNPFPTPIENDVLSLEVLSEMFTDEIDSENAVVGCTLER
jgi:hypothetical protein